jgi:hypothetical protein
MKATVHNPEPLAFQPIKITLTFESPTELRDLEAVLGPTSVAFPLWNALDKEVGRLVSND